MFQLINGVTYINGQNGKYDNKIQNYTVRYARNAVSNYLDTYSPETFINSQDIKAPIAPKLPKIQTDGGNFIGKLHNKLAAKLSIKKLDKYTKEMEEYLRNVDEKSKNIPTADFRLKYAETYSGRIDPIAPVAAAYEELGKNLKVSVAELTEAFKKVVSPQNADQVSAESLDLNKDGNVDVGEYAASILVEDMISSNASGKLKATDVNGEITNKGQTQLLAFTNKKNYQTAINIFSKVYSDFSLREATGKFIEEENNLIK